MPPPRIKAAAAAAAAQQRLVLALLVLALAWASGTDRSCKDHKAWKSKDGSTCDNYVKQHMCTEDGLPGEGWDGAFGTFADWADDAGMDAAQACCACGGGTEQLEVKHAQHA